MDEQLTFEFEQRPTIKGFPELRWTGKRPYRSTQYYPAQLREAYGEEQNGWINKIFWGDNLQVMSHLLKEYRGKIDLIYIDPPFDSKADYKKKIDVRGVGSTESDSTSFEEKQYGDIWTNDEYLQFMYERNEDTYLDILLSSSSLADLLNKADYITKISEYDRQKLQEYEETIQYIEQTKQNLESDYAELDTMKISLEDQKSALALVQQAKEQELAALSTQTTQTASTKAQLEKEMQEQENEILNLVAKKQQEDAAAKKAEKEKKNQNSSSGQNSNSNSNSSSNSGNSSTPSSSGFIWPTVSKRITSPFGDMEDRSSPHKGLDIGAVSVGVAGDPIYASASGTVIIAKYSATAGNYITIDHGNGFSTVYMHCSALKVSVGDTVTQGQTIGLMGTTGNSNGVHLHFAMIKNGTYVNPQSYL